MKTTNELWREALRAARPLETAWPEPLTRAEVVPLRWGRVLGVLAVAAAVVVAAVWWQPPVERGAATEIEVRVWGQPESEALVVFVVRSGGRP